MSDFVHMVPLATAGVLWFALYRLNKHRGWFRVGELIFWDAVLLVVVFLVWLIWF